MSSAKPQSFANGGTSGFAAATAPRQLFFCRIRSRAKAKRFGPPLSWRHCVDFIRIAPQAGGRDGLVADLEYPAALYDFHHSNKE